MLKSLLIERLLEKTADRIICISNAVKDTLVKSYHTKVNVIYNSVSFSGDNIVDSDNSNIDFSCDYILMVAQLIPWKKHDLLLNAMSLIIRIFPDLKLYIIGDDYFCDHKEYINKLNALIKSLDLNGSIRFFPYQSNIQLWLHHCLLVVHPADNEPLGRSNIEAMLCGKPVVASNSGGIPEYIIDGENGFLFQPNDIHDLATKLQEALCSTFLDRIGRQAKITAKKQFDPEQQSQKVFDVYQGCLKSINL